MKRLIIILLTSAFLSIVSCNDKPNVTTIDPSNRTLINIPLDELKTILAGNWLLKKSRDCGVAGCFTSTYPAGQEDIFSFLQQDSVKRVRGINNVVLVYDKASISKSSFNNAWIYEMAGGLRNWVFIEIKNDTLLAEIDQSQGGISHLVRKP